MSTPPQEREHSEVFTPEPAMPIDPDAINTIIDCIRAGVPMRRAVVAHGVHQQQFYRMLDRDASLRDRYARAREESMDAIAEEAMAIADDPLLDADQKRVMVDTRKWFLSKLAPKKYGDRIDLTVSANRTAGSMTDEELITLALRAKAALPAPVIDVQAVDAPG